MPEREWTVATYGGVSLALSCYGGQINSLSSGALKSNSDFNDLLDCVLDKKERFLFREAILNQLDKNATTMTRYVSLTDACLGTFVNSEEPARVRLACAKAFERAHATVLSRIRLKDKNVRAYTDNASAQGINWTMKSWEELDSMILTGKFAVTEETKTAFKEYADLLKKQRKMFDDTNRFKGAPEEITRRKDLLIKYLDEKSLTIETILDAQNWKSGQPVKIDAPSKNKPAGDAAPPDKPAEVPKKE